MGRGIFFLLIVAVLAMYSREANAQGESGVQGCPSRTEVWSNCIGCPATCDRPRPEACAAVCRPGCTCRPGYLRRRDGVCVRPFQCRRDGTDATQ